LRDGGRRKMVEQVQLISFERGTVTGLGLDWVFFIFSYFGFGGFCLTNPKTLEYK
jgi:hypothetical protein